MARAIGRSKGFVRGDGCGRVNVSNSNTLYDLLIHAISEPLHLKPRAASLLRASARTHACAPMPWACLCISDPQRPRTPTERQDQTHQAAVAPLLCSELKRASRPIESSLTTDQDLSAMARISKWQQSAEHPREYPRVQAWLAPWANEQFVSVHLTVLLRLCVDLKKQVRPTTKTQTDAFCKGSPAWNEGTQGQER
jgi:hypothetical protein